MSDFGPEGNCVFAQFKDVLTSGLRNGSEKLEEQKKENPTFWIETTQGMSGYFAVMLWDGDGFPEPWETGVGRYKTQSEAEKEGRQWALEEGIEFI